MPRRAGAAALLHCSFGAGLQWDHRSISEMTTAARIAVTMGDPAGIGPEVCLQLLADQASALREDVTAVPIVFGDAGLLHRVARSCGLPSPERVLSPEAWTMLWREIDGPAVVDLGLIDATCVEPGRISAETGRAAYGCIEAAIAAATAGQVAAITTAPIHKEALHLAGIPYPGHTEILAAKTAARRTCMMLTSDAITCSLVTTHVGLVQVPKRLTTERILNCIELTHEFLTTVRSHAPQLAVCALNPHGGEHGLFGLGEEERLIVPAIRAAQRQGMRVVGPLPPDTAFLPDRRIETDAYICMYHDQGLIPLKALAFDSAVNVTLGLPLIRTSVDHGTALDIAWRGEASASSLRHAFRLAARLAARQRSYVGHDSR